jgi:hypothetical protein
MIPESSRNKYLWDIPTKPFGTRKFHKKLCGHRGDAVNRSPVHKDIIGQKYYAESRSQGLDNFPIDASRIFMLQ